MNSLLDAGRSIGRWLNPPMAHSSLNPQLGCPIFSQWFKKYFSENYPVINAQYCNDSLKWQKVYKNSFLVGFRQAVLEFHIHET